VNEYLVTIVSPDGESSLFVVEATSVGHARMRGSHAYYRKYKVMAVPSRGFAIDAGIIEPE